jgi:hypothetical protein
MMPVRVDTIGSGQCTGRSGAGGDRPSNDHPTVRRVPMLKELARRRPVLTGLVAVAVAAVPAVVEFIAFTCPC